MNHHLNLDRPHAPTATRLVAVPDLDGDLLGALQLIHQVLALLAAWEQHDPETAADAHWALPHPLAGGAAAAALCTACDAALTHAAQPVTPTAQRRLDPIGWARLAPADLATLDLTARALALSLLPHRSPWAAEALTAVAADDGTHPEAIAAVDGRLHRLLSIGGDNSLAALAGSLPPGAGTVTLDHPGHLDYSQYLAAVRQIWHDGNPLTALRFGAPWP